MSKNQTPLILLGVGFLILILVLNLVLGGRDNPYSSYSTEPDGTKAAYLLLDELGFQVQRKTGGRWSGEGTLIALGPEYLGDTADAVTFEGDRRFTNAYIQDNAVEFVELMWPYRDGPIVFDEYGRSQVPIAPRSDAAQQASNAPAAPREDITVFSIMPPWLRLAGASVLFAAFMMMFFWNQRLGKPIPPKGFEGRPPLEGVHAMAGALERAKVFRDCASYYYSYCARNGNQWDKGRALEAGLGGLGGEREALELMSRLDQTIKEFRHEG